MITNALKNIVVPSLSYVSMALVIGGSCYLLKKMFTIKSTIKQKQITNNNVIPIIHYTSQSAIKYGDTSITINTHMDFIKAYEKMDKDKDIHIIMHTVGGSLSSAEAICNCILNHKQSEYKGNIIMYIPYYSYSGGCMISLACDKIVMGKNAILGPCDAQQYMTDSHHSVASIIDTVNYKKEKNEKINENWLAGAYNANLCKERQLKYVNKLIKHNIINDEVGNNVYDEFFSGKYNHDQIFSAQDAKDLGLNIEIVDVMPDMIKNFADYLLD
jgi:ClpP class serine protease